MTVVRLTVRNPSGIHARPAAQFVKTAGRFRSKIAVQNLTSGRGPADAKSILAVMPLGVAQGHEIEISADGEDADDALAAITQAVNEGLGEAIPPAD
jgi:phosphotransferase system HPr (HPr) family protein